MNALDVSGDENALFTIEKFERLSEMEPYGDFLRAVSGLMLSVNKENNFLHLKMWGAMNANGDSEKLKQDILSSRGFDLLHSTPLMLPINLLSEEYTCRNLEIMT